MLHHTAFQSNGIRLYCRVLEPGSAKLTWNVWTGLPSRATLTPHSGGARSFISTNLIRTQDQGPTNDIDKTLEKYQIGSREQYTRMEVTGVVMQAEDDMGGQVHVLVMTDG